MNPKRTVYSYDGLVNVITFTFAGVATWIAPQNGGWIVLSAVVSIVCVIAAARWVTRLRSPFIEETTGHLEIHSEGQTTKFQMSDVTEIQIRWLMGAVILKLVTGEKKSFGVPSLISKRSLYKVFPEFEPPESKKT
jgi:hypothetical protein